MSGTEAGERSGSRRGLAVAAAIVLVVAGAYAGLVFAVARPADVIEARPFTPAAKRALVAQLEAAQAERRRRGNSTAAITHVRRALGIAAAGGERTLAVYAWMRLMFHTGCHGAGFFNIGGLMRALELAREAPTVPALARRDRRTTTLQPS